MRIAIVAALAFAFLKLPIGVFIEGGLIFLASYGRRNWDWLNSFNECGFALQVICVFLITLGIRTHYRLEVASNHLAALREIRAREQSGAEPSFTD